jgi:hypothetical protein
VQSAEEKAEDCMKIIRIFCMGSPRFYVDEVYNRFWEKRDPEVFQNSFDSLNFVLDHMDLTYGEILEEKGLGLETESVDLVRRIIKTIFGFVDEIRQYILRGEEVKLIAAQLAGELKYQTEEVFEF